jgi:hypothetical protein
VLVTVSLTEPSAAARTQVARRLEQSRSVVKRSIRTVLVVAALTATSSTGAFPASSDPSARKACHAARLESRAAEVDAKLGRISAAMSPSASGETSSVTSGSSFGG